MPLPLLFLKNAVSTHRPDKHLGDPATRVPENYRREVFRTSTFLPTRHWISCVRGQRDGRAGANPAKQTIGRSLCRRGNADRKMQRSWALPLDDEGDLSLRRIGNQVNDKLPHGHLRQPSSPRPRPWGSALEGAGRVAKTRNKVVRAPDFYDESPILQTIELPYLQELTRVTRAFSVSSIGKTSCYGAASAPSPALPSDIS
jgi:hypothetical protein